MVNKNEIPIVFAANNDYVPYLGVALSSLVACANNKILYSIFVLHVNITIENQERLQKLSTENVIIQCKNVSKEMKGVNIISTNHLTAETTYRLLIPELFPQFDKVLYLDSDIVIIRDVSHLFDTDIECYIAGVSRELMNEHMKKHVDSLVLSFSDEYYFNAGVFLINTRLFTKKGIKEKCFNLLNDKKKYAYLDQDVLNIICHGDVLYLDERWNCCWHHWHYEALDSHNEIFIKSATDPWIIHFSSDKKPWTIPSAKFADYFWKFARNTPFYEEIIYKNTYANIRNDVKNSFKEYVLPLEQIPFGSDIAIYGAGKVGSAYQKQINFTGLYNLTMWVDNNYDCFQNDEHEIHAPKKLKSEIFDYVIIAVEKQSIAKEITKTLTEMGIELKKIIWTDPKIRTKWNMWFKNTKG